MLYILKDNMQVEFFDQSPLRQNPTLSDLTKRSTSYNMKQYMLNHGFFIRRILLFFFFLFFIGKSILLIKDYTLCIKHEHRIVK